MLPTPPPSSQGPRSRRVTPDGATIAQLALPQALRVLRVPTPPPSRHAPDDGRGCPVVPLLGAAFSVGFVIVLVNRDLMREKSFPFPVAISSMGVTFAAVASHASVFLGAVTLGPDARALLAVPQYVTCCIPIAACKAAAMMLGNAAYVHINMGLVQMMNSFAPVVTIFVMRLFGVGSLDVTIMQTVVVICTGATLTLSQDPTANWIGMSLMLGSMVADALSVVLTQRLLQAARLGVIEAQFLLAPPGAVMLLCVACGLEWHRIHERRALRQVAAHSLNFVAAATLGLLCNLLSTTVIQRTSSVTLKILNVARSVVLVAVGVLLYGERVTRLEVIGFAVSAVGFVAYTWWSASPSTGRLTDDGTEGRASPTPAPPSPRTQSVFSISPDAAWSVPRQTPDPCYHI
eukprot:TRINITY_DN38778_c0_g1_i1.p1 TRINITY_DN38778_c0_g1~~TRINITY_DN38778_c0_g1_i1.p1  ORF type:complete len:424 (+),score=66.02 TRINITY_DN38778_c0_g1_i1:63-1274(+)